MKQRIRKPVTANVHGSNGSANRIVLVGTYKGDQLTKWRGRYNYPVSEADQIAEADAASIAELREKVDFFVQTKEPPLQSIFYQNRFWDAKSLLIKFIRRAKKELIVIDAYPSVATLDMLAKRGRGVFVFPNFCV